MKNLITCYKKCYIINIKLEKQKADKKRQPMDGSTMINPKEFFQRQSETITDEYLPKINEFVKSLIDY